ncbi:MAG: isochorismatase family protein [Simkaniaceae bacterium]|nr:isochorismatase family protein [Simkaniaceae bacterium]
MIGTTYEHADRGALLLVDLQYDFMPGGALGIKGGDELIPVINRITEFFSLVIASRDCHPADHVSFAHFPPHCVVGTKGAELVEGLNRKKITKYVLKGEDPRVDSYSVFFDNEKKKKSCLDRFLRERHVRDLYVAGLATDYCVLETVLDGIALGYEVTVIADACRALEAEEGDEKRALERMCLRGAHIITSEALPVLVSHTA